MDKETREQIYELWSAEAEVIMDKYQELIKDKPIKSFVIGVLVDDGVELSFTDVEIVGSNMYSGTIIQLLQHLYTRKILGEEDETDKSA